MPEEAPAGRIELHAKEQKEDEQKEEEEEAEDRANICMRHLNAARTEDFSAFTTH